MTSTLPKGTLGSVTSLLAATRYQGNPDRNHKQTTTYIKLRSTSTDAFRSRHNSEKETVVLEKYRKLERGELSRRDYVCILSYTFQPFI
jgi:hypothetical protein